MSQPPHQPSEEPQHPRTPPPPYTATQPPRPAGIISPAALTATILTYILHNNLTPPTQPKPHSIVSILHRRSLLLEDSFFNDGHLAHENRPPQNQSSAVPGASVKFADLVVVLGRLLRVLFWRQHGFPSEGAGFMFENARREAMDVRNACLGLPFFQRGRAEAEVFGAGDTQERA